MTQIRTLRGVLRAPRDTDDEAQSARPQAPLRGALLGCGFFAENQLRAWRELEGVEIVALCDLDAARLERFAASFSFSPSACYTEAERLLEEVALDFVDIAAPTSAHRSLITLACAHRVPVICQKPFATDLNDARMMIAACTRAGVSLTVHENFRWQAAVRETIDALRDGAIGEPFFARISYRSGFDVFRAQPYLARTKRFIIADLGIHLLDIARALFGEVDRLGCQTRRVSADIEGEDVATMMLAHASGVTSIVDCSYATRQSEDPFPQTLIEIDGERGSIRLLAGFRLQIDRLRDGRIERTERLVAPSAPSWSTPPWTPIQQSVVRFQADWLAKLKTDDLPETHGIDNFHTLALVEAAYQAAEERRIVIPQRW
ncbi:Gfo/Idh/MocA family protein [Halotalea alkalilenta]|uniref:Gfo/Idh/MocA family protein n=1 Tax=Halotalea alkalilenta TaxID=376489 RepID=UPI0009DD9732|nr:Gfo/Idh/MocA family oxidoreductase [Halotalea alkalilenta]